MKKLIFIRHGKSDWSEGRADVDRSLKKRGVEDGKIIATNFKDKAYNIDKVFSSHANRAYSTCKIFKSVLDWPEGIVSKNEELYDFQGEAILKFIKNLNNKNNIVALFGHNYAFTSIINVLGDKYVDNLPTTGLAVIKFDIEAWEFAKYGQTELLMFPRDYKH